MIAEFKSKIDSINVVETSLPQYVYASLESDPEGKLCRGWDFLKKNITPELKAILLSEEYWTNKYNTEKIDHIINQLVNGVTKEHKDQLGAFVYVYNDMKREAEKEHERIETINKGYTEISGMDKAWDNIKVKGVFKLSKIGMLGSFDKEEELEGTLRYSDYYKCLMIIPKGRRTKGHLIKDKAYVKRMGGQDVL